MAQQEVQNGGSDKAAAEVTFTAVKPQLFVEAPKATEAVQFYKAAFGAVEAGRTTQPKRKADQELPHIISSQLQLAGTTILVSDLADDSALVKTEGSGFPLVLETESVEAAISKAVAAGAVAEGEIVEGDGVYAGAGRVGKVKDPYGFVWVISSGAEKKSVVTVEA
ncbi:Lactoylglutathione lyase / glyoxalase I family protein [Euphorbia peplus]|nr:Lactoylglutathione lyase / glyoxalase I family protein [Euphorbia peplus]